MTAIDRLSKIEARANAATEGPWLPEYSAGQGTCVIPADAESTREAVCVTRLYRRGPDSVFIAAARTDVPALVAALRAVLELHDTELINDGDDDEAIICQECGYIYDDEEPCPTVRAIEEALS